MSANDGLVEELREAARNHVLVAALWPPDSPEHANAIEGDELLSKAADRITALEASPTFEDGLERAALLYKFGGTGEYSRGWNAALDAAIRALKGTSGD
jgi:hypothetical protein